MGDKNFPVLMLNTSKSGIEGILGLKLTSVLHADLLMDSLAPSYERGQLLRRIDPEYHQQCREAFLHAAYSILKSVSLEIHLTCLPNLASRSQGMIWFNLFLRASGRVEKSVKTRLIECFLGIKPLLKAYFPEIEFEAITQTRELKQRYRPFTPKRVVLIQRRYEKHSLCTLLKQNSIGFGFSGKPAQGKDHEISHRFPWIPSHDGGAQLMKTAMGHLDPLQVVVRLKSAGAAEKQAASDRLAQTIELSEHFMSGLDSRLYTLKSNTKLLRDIAAREQAMLDGPCFRTGVFILGPSKIDGPTVNIVGRSITMPSSASSAASLFQGGFEASGIAFSKATKASFFVEKEPLQVKEAAGAFLLPFPPHENIPGLSIKRSRTALAVLPVHTISRRNHLHLFQNADQGIDQPVEIGPDERMRHMFIAGQTGTGKSTFMENMILQDIRAGRGMTVIDPHGDLVDGIIGKIPQKREDDVIVFDLLDRQFPVGLNIIEWTAPDERDLIIDDLYQTLNHLYDMQSVGGPIFESHFRGMLRLLMGAAKRPGFVPTLLDFPRCYTDKAFRDWLKRDMDDKRTIEFVREIERAGGDARLENISQYITSKLSRFFNDDGLRRIVGQASTSFDFDTIMNDSKIFLVKLGRGRFGSTVSGLIANHLVTRFKMAAMKRGNIPLKDRRDFFLYVDECHSLPAENFIDLLSEARKFRMGLVLATQYTAQIKNPVNRGSSMLSAVLGNVSSIVMFRMGQEDAQGIAQVINPYFSMCDITNLPNWQGYARLQSAHGTILPFSFYTIKDSCVEDVALAERILCRSRKKYGQPAADVDRSINGRTVKCEDNDFEDLFD